MAFELDRFRSALAYDGARPNLFEVVLVPPTGIIQSSIAGQQITLFCRSAQIPGSTMGSVPVFYMGRELKVPGNAMYQEWTLTIMNDEDFAARKVFERWHGKLNSHAGNVRDKRFLSSKDYSVNASVVQYSKTGTGTAGGNRGAQVNDSATGIRRYNLIGCWPIDISPIDLDWGANDAIEEYVITLAYQWWESDRDPDASITSKAFAG